MASKRRSRTALLIGPVEKKWTLEQLSNYIGYSLRTVKENARHFGITPIETIRRLADQVRTSKEGAAFSNSFYRQLYARLDARSPADRKSDGEFTGRPNFW